MAAEALRTTSASSICNFNNNGKKQPLRTSPRRFRVIPSNALRQRYSNRCSTISEFFGTLRLRSSPPNISTLPSRPSKNRSFSVVAMANEGQLNTSSLYIVIISLILEVTHVCSEKWKCQLLCVCVCVCVSVCMGCFIFGMDCIELAFFEVKL